MKLGKSKETILNKELDLYNNEYQQNDNFRVQTIDTIVGAIKNTIPLRGLTRNIRAITQLPRRL